MNAKRNKENNFLKSNYSYAFALSTNQTADKRGKIMCLINISDDEIQEFYSMVLSNSIIMPISINGRSCVFRYISFRYS